MAQQIRSHGLKREFKQDGSIVTNADREIEAFLTRKLTALLPGSAVWGEEFGLSGDPQNPMWVIDPVDGTSNFAYNSWLWGVSAALVDGRDITVGAVSIPDQDEVFAGHKGGGVTRNGERLPNLPEGPILAHELVGYSDRVLRSEPERPLPGKMRHSGAFVVDGTSVACGRLRALIGCRERLYDIAACVLLGQELGGFVGNLDGTPLDIERLRVGEKLEDPWVIFPQGAL